MQTICRLYFSSSNVYKIIATETDKVVKRAIPASTVQQKLPTQMQPEVAEFEVKCTQCGNAHKLYAKLVDDPSIDANFKGKGTLPYPKSNRLKCNCGFEIDLSGIRNELESQTGKKIVT